jgi:hypothetical protein
LLQKGALRFDNVDISTVLSRIFSGLNFKRRDFTAEGYNQKEFPLYS